MRVHCGCTLYIIHSPIFTPKIDFTSPCAHNITINVSVQESLWFADFILSDYNPRCKIK